MNEYARHLFLMEGKLGFSVMDDDILRRIHELRLSVAQVHKEGTVRFLHSFPFIDAAHEVQAGPVAFATLRTYPLGVVDT